MTLRTLRTLAVAFMALGMAQTLTSCDFSAGKDNPGYEYAPDMYYSVPYEPYKQLKRNTLNPDGTNLRQPPMHTVARNTADMAGSPVELWDNYPYSQDSIEYASRTLRNPFPYSDSNMAQGKYLYTAYCYPCHGEKGDGNGPVGQVYGGVANYNAANLKGMTDGHIFHVITMGKGRMWPHGSQVLPKDRWKIVMYVNKLRGLTGPQTTYTAGVNAGGQ
jgi:hypothetical protein